MRHNFLRPWRWGCFEKSLTSEYNACYFTIFVRYLKYLTKKYMKKNNLRDWLRVVSPSTSKDTYELRYFNINNDEEDEDDDADE